MSAIHLIVKAGTAQGTAQGLKTIDFKAGLFQRGYWKVTSKTAKKLVGGSIFLHTSWSEPSHFGGKISTFSVYSAPGSKEDGRIIFQFTSLPANKGVSAPAGASGEKRIVW